MTCLGIICVARKTTKMDLAAAERDASECVPGHRRRDQRAHDGRAPRCRCCSSRPARTARRSRHRCSCRRSTGSARSSADPAAAAAGLERGEQHPEEREHHGQAADQSTTCSVAETPTDARRSRSGAFGADPAGTCVRQGSGCSCCIILVVDELLLGAELDGRDHQCEHQQDDGCRAGRTELETPEARDRRCGRRSCGWRCPGPRSGSG